jgi:hypothetical protein
MTTASLIQQVGQNWPGWAIWLRRQRLRRSLNRAITRAYASFARQYPEWVDYAFDIYFLRQRAFPLLARYLEDRAMPTSYELAQLWSEQFPRLNQEMMQQHTAQLRPVAADFLRRLDQELFQ